MGVKNPSDLKGRKKVARGQGEQSEARHPWYGAMAIEPCRGGRSPLPEPVLRPYRARRLRYGVPEAALRLPLATLSLPLTG